MGHRRSIAAIKVVAESGFEPIICFCGADKFEHAWSRFPMRHVSTCVACGLTQSAELKITPPRRPSAQPPARYDPGDDWR
jgi:hypothetical protein